MLELELGLGLGIGEHKHTTISQITLYDDLLVFSIQFVFLRTIKLFVKEVNR